MPSCALHVNRALHLAAWIPLSISGNQVRLTLTAMTTTHQVRGGSEVNAGFIFDAALQQPRGTSNDMTTDDSISRHHDQIFLPKPMLADGIITNGEEGSQASCIFSRPGIYLAMNNDRSSCRIHCNPCKNSPWIPKCFFHRMPTRAKYHVSASNPTAYGSSTDYPIRDRTSASSPSPPIATAVRLRAYPRYRVAAPLKVDRLRHRCSKALGGCMPTRPKLMVCLG